MALTNTNEVIIKGTTGLTLNTTFIRVVSGLFVDNKENETIFDLEFAFFTSKEKWNEDYKANRIKINGIDRYRLKVSYSRTRDGVDILAHIYTKLIENLITIFPTWDANKLVPELLEPEV